VHRDYVPGTNKLVAPSRGFGFVEFEHHAHALACLREVNNSTLYSAEFASGGKQAAEMKRRRAGKKPRKQTAVDDEGALANDSLVDPTGKVRTPRLIVEFTVENKAKAKQQAAHRAQQQANQLKQVEEKRGGTESNKAEAKIKKTKKSRGAKQRERKRKQLGEGGEPPAVEPAKDEQVDTPSRAPVEKKKKKSTKPPKKQKIDRAEEKLTSLVDSYKKDAVAIVNSGEKTSSGKNAGKRWFEA